MRKNEAKWIEGRARWQINIQHDGERRTFISSTIGKKGKIEAERKADKWIENKQKKDVRFSILWDMFLAEAKSTTSTSNYKKHEQVGRLWLCDLKHKRLSTITSQDLQNILNRAYKKGLSKKSIMNIRASITCVWKYAAKDKRPFERPFALDIPKDAPTKEKNILQPDDFRTLFSQDKITIRKREVPCFFIHSWRFQVLTGMRPGEVAGLKKVDIKDNLLTIKRSINVYNEITKGKNKNAQRTMILTKHAVSVLADQESMLKSHGIISPWIFPDTDGSAMDTRNSYEEWRKYRSQHGIASSLYELRHTMISLTKSDIPKPLLQLIVGHSESMDTFGIYGHEVTGELDRAASILDGVFDNLLKKSTH